jgi:hypothetical protein
MTGYLAVMLIMGLALTAVAIVWLSDLMAPSPGSTNDLVLLLGDSGAGEANWASAASAVLTGRDQLDLTELNASVAISALAYQRCERRPARLVLLSAGGADARLGTPIADFEQDLGSLVGQITAARSELICFVSTPAGQTDPWRATAARVCTGFGGSVVVSSRELVDRLRERMQSDERGYTGVP